MWFATKKRFTKHDIARNVQDAIGREVVELEAVEEKETADKRMDGTAEAMHEVRDKAYPLLVGCAGLRHRDEPDIVALGDERCACEGALRR